MLPLITIPDLIKSYAPQYEDIFTEEGYVHFQRFLSGLLISENKTIQAINRLFVLDLKDQSSLNRFLNSSPFDEEKLNTRRLEMLQSNEHTCFKYPLKGCPKGTHPGCISVDDTLLEHVGKKIDGIYVIWCHVKGCYVYAHQLVTLHYSDDKCDYPIYSELWKPVDLEQLEAALDDQEVYINPDFRATRKVEDKKAWRKYLLARYKAYQYKKPKLQETYKTKLHMARDLLTKFYQTYPEVDIAVSFDSWYTKPYLCQYIDKELKRPYVGSLTNENEIVLAQGKVCTLPNFAQTLKNKY